MLADDIVREMAMNANVPEDAKAIFRLPEEKTQKVNQIHRILGPDAKGPKSIKGRDYLERSKNAGKRPVEVTLENNVVKVTDVYHPSLVRQDIIEAIHAYIGYDSRENFGEQEARARQAAMQEVRPVKAQAYARCAVAPSIAGYVAGMPDPERRLAQDVQAKLRLKIEEMKDSKGNFKFNKDKRS